MSCRRVQSLLSAFVDCELTGNEMLAIGTHLNACAYCQAEYQSLSQLKRLLGSLPSSMPDNHLVSTLEDLAQSNPLAVCFVRQRREMRRAFGLATADENSRAMEQANGHALGLACALGVLGAWFVVAPMAFSPEVSHIRAQHPRLNGVLNAAGLFGSNRYASSSLLDSGKDSLGVLNETNLHEPISPSLPVNLGDDQPQFAMGYSTNAFRHVEVFPITSSLSASYTIAPSQARFVSTKLDASR